ncbi:DUF1842 domain-containing protein [Celerinatantimonas diazotrophica]|uniref:Uncharacterized protein DUF1842 n=1 Tax=Celerinatantimonas diazotrophica TaxID=412034 RepID=A0A4R1KI99_9GAMM|nr:DUF1842 domain-containing protein [Celerinatantimonas diazotrophica]TCK63987.1 uncharacterized protein DUF1842 [Celerinatantimonas diazotrophica]CAG9297075.1 hypothetical protein CEDIAZO_02237 [Celerinatantimonas diazotrophica]
MAKAADSIVTRTYCIKTNSEIAEAPVCTLFLSEDVSDGEVIGLCVVEAQAESPESVYCKAVVQGSESEMVFGPNVTLNISLQGYPYIKAPSGSNFPVQYRNFQLQMVLDKDRKEGTATYHYLSPTNGEWSTQANVPVRML